MKQSNKNLLFFALVLLPMLLMAHDVTEADRETLTNGSLLDYIWVGAKHMITGYDHILFLIGVIFYLDGFKDIVKFITAFTIGHSITLTGATYLGLQADEHLIDAVIAFSVIYKGFENLGGFKELLGIKSPNLLLMVGIFGLIHGFGLSTRLQSFDIGTENFLAKILSFNVGVELGQIAALIPIVFIISKWKSRKSYTAFYKAANWFLVLAGSILLLYQLYGYSQSEHDHHHDEHHHEHLHDGHTHDGEDAHLHDHSHDGEHSHDHGDGNAHSHDDEHSHSHD
ncbi:MAG: HupE/UreJ family protein [Bacteroidota bacterium]